MSGKLFQLDEIPTTPIKAEYAVEVQDMIINELKESYPDLVCFGLGSVGHKYEDSGDIDIGVKCNDIEELFDIVNNVFYYTNTVESKTFFIISIKYPYQVNDEPIKYVSVDFILVNDIDYTKFRYYCPNYKIGESKYKVGTKIMFVGSILNHCLDQNPGDGCHYKYMFRPTGLFLTIYDIKTKTYEEELVTTNPQEVVDIMFTNRTPDVCNTVESLWEAVHSEDFKYPNMVKHIELSLFVNSYRKGWEELVKCEDFDLQYWTVSEIHKHLKQQQLLRNINIKLFNLQ